MNDMQSDIRELQGEVFGDDAKREPGLKRRQAATDLEMHGDGNMLGIKSKVNILWRLHVWALCSLSATFGAVVTVVVQQIYKSL